MKKNVIHILFLLPMLICMCIIFCFSSEPATESAKTSGKTIKVVLKITMPEFKNMETEKQDEIVRGFQFYARKSAHFLLYFMLGFTSALASFHFMKKNIIRCVSAFSVSALYCISDEIHQIFVPGRACQLRDVLIDMSGSAVGILIFLAFFSLRLFLKSKRAKHAAKAVPEK